MINESLNWKPEAAPRPFLLKPAGKDYLWGGTRLNDDFAKGIALEPLAETWECSTHPDGLSTVASGEYAGETLAAVLAEHPEYLGTHPAAGEGLPILLKLIDAKSDLSVQVHPTDAYAAAYENGQRGKTEMWYVLDAAPGASLVYGFRQDISREKLRRSLENGTVEKYLQKVEIHPDDVFFIEAGQVHAIGAGALIAEVQESSNLTYRMFDYNRRDKNGALRPLHIDKALAVANLAGSAAPRQPLRVLRYRRGSAAELLCRCKYFQAERLLINTERCRELAEVTVDTNSFQVLLCTAGCGVLVDGTGASLNFFRGDCIFAPAGAAPMHLHGRAQFLKVMC